MTKPTSYLNDFELDTVSGGVKGYIYCNNPGTYAGLYGESGGCPVGFMTGVANAILDGAKAASKSH